MKSYLILEDERIDHVVKSSRWRKVINILFTLFKRVAPPNECLKYILTKQKDKRRGSRIKRNENTN